MHAKQRETCARRGIVANENALLPVGNCRRQFGCAARPLWRGDDVEFLERVGLLQLAFEDLHHARRHIEHEVHVATATLACHAAQWDGSRANVVWRNRVPFDDVERPDRQ